MSQRRKLSLILTNIRRQRRHGEGPSLQRPPKQYKKLERFNIKEIYKWSNINKTGLQPVSRPV